MRWLLGLSAGLSILVAACGNVDSCPAKGQFKGIELYSWKSQAGDWRFTLLPGTNRQKTELEIKRENSCMLSLNELAPVFKGLGGETVFWTVDESLNVALPPEELIGQVMETAKDAGVSIYVPGALMDSLKP